MDRNQIGECGCMEKRKPHFSEMTQDEKINKLASELFRTQQQVKKLTDAVKILGAHSHQGEKILIPLKLDSQQEEMNYNSYFRVNDNLSK